MVSSHSVIGFEMADDRGGNHWYLQGNSPDDGIFLPFIKAKLTIFLKNQ